MISCFAYDTRHNGLNVESMALRYKLHPENKIFVLVVHHKNKLNNRPNGPVSLTWFLPNNIFLYQTMTKGCYMPNIYAFIRPQRGPPPLFE